MTGIAELKNRFVEFIEYRPLKQAKAKLAKLEDECKELTRADRIMAEMIASAEANLLDCEARLKAGIDGTTEADVKKARKELELARGAHIEQNPAVAVNLRAQELVKEQIAALEAESENKLKEAMCKDYLKATKKLAEAMEAAAKANQEAALLFDLAQQEFPGYDCPGIVTDTPIGLKSFAWRQFLPNGKEVIYDGSPTLYARWKREIEQFLSGNGG